MITTATPQDYAALLAVWESAVRATHAFLSENDIAALHAQLPIWFAMVNLRVWRDPQGQIRGFVGMADETVEMLFIDADSHGKGIGRSLLRWAIEQGANKLDVNEQNPQALAFYQHCGFEITGRSALDGQGRPFPLLHMHYVSK
ncbi:GNAT family N-acetyltransferase [Atlantibacter hermannii]|uniref:GNAT family N-acetyltransferase n=1 Tax=Atlantibacter hermannii TaxID=565 RepID=UPI0013EF1EA1|nr:GNAT family N-acetyltransferase [Atlantibacter hermannii]